jgi:uncharacterized protein YhaN
VELIHLNLRAYGPFTNTTLQFQNGSASPNLHLILGPNEAGKSTALRGLRAVLFGMDARDAHLHPADMLRASLKLRTADGQLLDVERRKGKGAKSLLFTESGKPVPLEAWTRVLPVSDQELFESMFGLDYDSLVKGGRQLAEFKGEIGRTILTAAGDLGATAERIQKLRGLADEIYAPQATARKLNKALRAYKEADSVIRRERFTSAKYKEAISRQSELKQELEDISRELTECARKQNRLTRLQTAAPHVQRYHKDLGELNTLADVILLRSDFEQRMNKLTNGLSNAKSRKKELEAELARLAAELATIQREPELALLLSDIERLHSEIGKIKASREDLPKRETALHLGTLEQEKLCHELGMQPGSVPQLTAEQRKRIGSLSIQHFGLQKTREELPGRIARLEARIKELGDEWVTLPANADTTAISQWLSQIPPKKQSGTETKRLKAAYDQSAARLQVDLQALPIWNGTAEQLEAARVPLTASVSEMASRFTMQKGNEAQLAKDEGKLRSDLDRCELQLRALEKKGVIPTEEQLAAARDLREIGWTAVKDQWLNGSVGGAAEMTFLSGLEGPLPTAFEATVEAADSLADRLRLEAERVEQKRTALDEQNRVKQLMGEHAGGTQLALSQRRELEGEWVALWADAGVQPRTPSEMVDWLEKRGKLIEQARDLRRTASEISDAEREETQWREELASALGVSPAHELPELVLRARQLVEESSRVRERRAALITRKRKTEASLQAEVLGLQDNQKAVETWESRWKAALRDTHLNECADPATLSAVMGLIDSFWNQATAIKELERRIQSMWADDAKYSADVRALAVKTGRAQIADLDALAAIKEVEKLARAAANNEQSVARIQQDRLREQQELDKATADIERVTSAVDELLREANVQDVSFIPKATERSKREKTLTEAVRAHLEALALSARNIPLDSFVEQVQGVNAESQKRKQEEHSRKQEQHQMKKDHHEWAVALSEAKVYHQQNLTARQERLAETAQLLTSSPVC